MLTLEEESGAALIRLARVELSSFYKGNFADVNLDVRDV